MAHMELGRNPFLGSFLPHFPLQYDLSPHPLTPHSRPLVSDIPFPCRGDGDWGGARENFRGLGVRAAPHRVAWQGGGGDSSLAVAVGDELTPAFAPLAPQTCTKDSGDSSLGLVEASDLANGCHQANPLLTHFCSLGREEGSGEPAEASQAPPNHTHPACYAAHDSK